MKETLFGRSVNGRALICTRDSVNAQIQHHSIRLKSSRPVSTVVVAAVLIALIAVCIATTDSSSIAFTSSLHYIALVASVLVVWLLYSELTQIREQSITIFTSQPDTKSNSKSVVESSHADSVPSGIQFTSRGLLSTRHEFIARAQLIDLCINEGITAYQCHYYLIALIRTDSSASASSDNNDHVSSNHTKQCNADNLKPDSHVRLVLPFTGALMPDYQLLSTIYRGCRHALYNEPE